MGGRGSSGGGGLSGKLPQAAKPIDMDNLPQLSGSAKQVSWANQVRENVVAELVSAMRTTKDGRPTGAIDYIFSGKDMKSWVNSTKSAFSTSAKATQEYHINNSIKALTTAASQFQNLRTLIKTETSARFWINHRNTHPADPTWKALKKKIVGY